MGPRQIAPEEWRRRLIRGIAWYAQAADAARALAEAAETEAQAATRRSEALLAELNAHDRGRA